MYYLTEQQKLKSALNQVLVGTEFRAEEFIDQIFSILNEREIILEEVGIVFRLLTRIIAKEKHRDQLTELLDENFDWPQDMLKEIATEIDDHVLSPLQKHIKNYEPEQTKLASPEVPQNIPAGKPEIRNNFAQKFSQDKMVQTETADQKSEIEILKEKIKKLEEKQWQNLPPEKVKNDYQMPTAKISPQKTEIKRFGITPARDLGAEDFDWKGNVGGVEIEGEEKESGEEEVLDKAQILEEVENPPSYSPTTSFENRLKKNNAQTDFRTEESEAPAEQINLTQEKMPEEEVVPEEIEQERKETYKSGDPYREPIE